MNVAETYRKMYEEEEKPVFTAHHFTMIDSLHHHKNKFDSLEHAHNHALNHGELRNDEDQDHLGHVIVKHHKGQVTAVKSAFPHGEKSYPKHMIAGIAKDAEEQAKKLNVSKMKTEKEYHPDEDGRHWAYKD